MELMKTSLEQLARANDFRQKVSANPVLVTEYALQIAAGMSHLEAEGICHRDVRKDC